MSMFVLAEALFCPLMLVHLVGWVRATQARSIRSLMGWSILGGVAAGLAILTRPSWLLFTPFVLLLLVSLSGDRFRHLWIGVVILVSVAVVMSPWWLAQSSGGTQIRADDPSGRGKSLRWPEPKCDGGK